MNLRDLNNIDFGELVQQLRTLDLNDIGSWPAAGRAALVVLACLAVGFLGYWYIIRDQLDNLESAQAQEQELRQTFETKQKRVANLDAYKEQLEEMRRSFGNMLRQLPSETEMSSLLQDISQTRVATGLEEELFKPQSEQPKEFYAEAPISIRVIGSYHQFGEFASGIAGLPRIVTLNDISIEQQNSKNGRGNLVMNATAMTYRYLENTGGQQGGGNR